MLPRASIEYVELLLGDEFRRKIARELLNSNSKLRLIAENSRTCKSKEAYDKLRLHAVTEIVEELLKTFKSQGIEGEDQEFQSLITSLENRDQRVSFVQSLMSWPLSQNKISMQLKELNQRIYDIEQAFSRSNDPREKSMRIVKEVTRMLETGPLKDNFFKRLINIQALRLPEPSNNPQQEIGLIQNFRSRILDLDLVESIAPGLISRNQPPEHPLSVVENTQRV